MVEPIFDFLNGGIAFLIVIGAIIFAIFNFRRYIKTKASTTFYVGVLSLTSACGWTGISLSFISVLFTGGTPPGIAGIISYFSYLPIPIGSCAVIIIAWDWLFTPKYKKAGVGFFCILYTIYYVFLFMTWQQTVVYSNVPGQVFDDWLSLTSVSFWMIWIIVGLSGILWIIGFNNFRKKSSGALQTRAIQLFFAAFFLISAILLDTVIFTGIFTDFLWVARLLMAPAVYFGYKGTSPI